MWPGPKSVMLSQAGTSSAKLSSRFCQNDQIPPGNGKRLQSIAVDRLDIALRPLAEPELPDILGAVCFVTY